VQGTLKEKMVLVAQPEYQALRVFFSLIVDHHLLTDSMEQLRTSEQDYQVIAYHQLRAVIEDLDQRYSGRPYAVPDGVTLIAERNAAMRLLDAQSFDMDALQIRFNNLTSAVRDYLDNADGPYAPKARAALRAAFEVVAR
jgi:hypothetical protein